MDISSVRNPGALHFSSGFYCKLQPLLLHGLLPLYGFGTDLILHNKRSVPKAIALILEEIPLALIMKNKNVVLFSDCISNPGRRNLDLIELYILNRG
ncbi:hypothetical protein BS78_04G086600 [Paspalum vaginatum]|nr:hypothetical protein BS78_04G086600 [Paspalum vaginatum]